MQISRFWLAIDYGTFGEPLENLSRTYLFGSSNMALTLPCRERSLEKMAEGFFCETKGSVLGGGDQESVLDSVHYYLFKA